MIPRTLTVVPPTTQALPTQVSWAQVAVGAATSAVLVVLLAAARRGVQVVAQITVL